MKSNAEEYHRRAYDELRIMARRYLRGDDVDSLVQPTVLANDVVRKLLDSLEVGNRQILATAVARAMRRALVAVVQEEERASESGSGSRILLQDETRVGPNHAVRILDIDRALSRLEARSEQVGLIAEMMIFGGLTEDEIADHIGSSKDMIVKDWALARAWLAREMERQSVRVPEKSIG